MLISINRMYENVNKCEEYFQILFWSLKLFQIILNDIYNKSTSGNYLKY